MITRPAITVLGAGSWGTAVALHLSRAGFKVSLWGHDPAHVEAMKREKCNQRYLPGILFPENLHPVSHPDSSQQSEVVILAVPSHAFADVFSRLQKPAAGLAWLTKGLDPETHLFLSECVAARWGTAYPVAIISGPSFAKEVAQGLPTALTVAGNERSFQKLIQNCLHQDNIRVYLSHDLCGVQLAGAVKNVLAIACGISDGLGFGANAKAALITRGLHEMKRLGLALGAREETFAGLAGLGDLVLTCTDDQSRNRRFGLYLGQGIEINAAQKKIGQVVEGKHNASQVLALASSHRIEMPICEQVTKLLKSEITPQDAVNNLLKRSVGTKIS